MKTLFLQCVWAFICNTFIIIRFHRLHHCRAPVEIRSNTSNSAVTSSEHNALIAGLMDWRRHGRIKTCHKALSASGSPALCDGDSVTRPLFYLHAVLADKNKMNKSIRDALFESLEQALWEQEETVHHQMDGKTRGGVKRKRQISVLPEHSTISASAASSSLRCCLWVSRTPAVIHWGGLYEPND